MLVRCSCVWSLDEALVLVLLDPTCTYPPHRLGAVVDNEDGVPALD